MQHELGKLLLLIGLICIIIGVMLLFGGRLFNIGRLPGDIAYEGKNVKIYFPIASSITISILLTIILRVIAYFSRR